jgi:hypothetical protein
MACTRARLYCIITLCRSTHWNTQLPLYAWLEMFTALRVMSAEVLFANPDPLAYRMPTAAEAHRRSAEPRRSRSRRSTRCISSLTLRVELLPRAGVATARTRCGRTLRRGGCVQNARHTLGKVGGRTSTPTRRITPPCITGLVRQVVCGTGVWRMVAEAQMLSDESPDLQARPVGTLALASMRGQWERTHRPSCVRVSLPGHDPHQRASA